MTKSRISNRRNDLIQLTLIVTILMSFAGYEAKQKQESLRQDSQEFSSQDQYPTLQQDSVRLTKATLHTHPAN